MSFEMAVKLFRVQCILVPLIPVFQIIHVPSFILKGLFLCKGCVIITLLATGVNLNLHFSEDSYFTINILITIINYFGLLLYWISNIYLTSHNVSNQCPLCSLLSESHFFPIFLVFLLHLFNLSFATSTVKSLHSSLFQFTNKSFRSTFYTINLSISISKCLHYS